MTTRAAEAGDRHFLARILETPHLEQVVPRLEPEILHQMIRVCGLEDSTELVALATAAQLMRVFDRDLWRSERAGVEDQFDVDRFGVWLEVLVEAGAALAAQRVVEMDVEFVAAAFSHYVRVWVPAPTLRDESDGDDEFQQPDAAADALSCQIGGYTVIARRGDSWDALLSLLVTLDADHRHFFERLMARCWHTSNDQIEDNGIMYDVVSYGEQILSDAAADRERRREGQGYVTPAQAVAFLESSRCLPLTDLAAPAWDFTTLAYFRDAAHRAKEDADRMRTEPPAEPAQRSADDDTERHLAVFMTMLQEAGVVGRSAPAGLLEGTASGASRLALLKAGLQYVEEHDAAAYAARLGELGYLANVLMAGCSIDTRRFTAAEASEVVSATCNLGLQQWPRHWQPPATARPTSRGRRSSSQRDQQNHELLVTQDLVTVFRVGWAVVHDRVCLHTAQRLVQALAEIESSDFVLQEQLSDLRHRLRRHLSTGTPWRARDDLDVLAILDLPSWTILLRLLDECPRVPKFDEESSKRGRLLRVTSEFEFISETSQLAWVGAFVESIPERLLT